MKALVSSNLNLVLNKIYLITEKRLSEIIEFTKKDLYQLVFTIQRVLEMPEIANHISKSI